MLELMIPISDIELVLIIQVVFGIDEIFPLRLGLVGRSRVVIIEQVRMSMLHVLLLPLAVLTATLDGGDKWVEGDRVVAGVGEVEGGAELEAAVAVTLRLFRRMREEEEE